MRVNSYTITDTGMYFIIEGNPRKNRRHGVSATGQRYNTKEHKALIASLARAHRESGAPTMAHGTLEVTIVTYWPKFKRCLPGALVPLGDVDAPISGILDAMEKAGVIDNDARVVRLAAEKHHGAANTHVVVRRR